MIIKVRPQSLFHLFITPIPVVPVQQFEYIHKAHVWCSCEWPGSIGTECPFNASPAGHMHKRVKASFTSHCTGSLVDCGCALSVCISLCAAVSWDFVCWIALLGLPRFTLLAICLPTIVACTCCVGSHLARDSGGTLSRVRDSIVVWIYSVL